MNRAAPNAGSGLENLLEEFAGRLGAGEALDVAAFAAAHPEHAEQLRRVLPTMLVPGDLGRSASGGAAPPPAGADSEPVPGVLGDFRVLREVGRGGMGVVYEAEQISLGRRVALKVLPFAATMDPRQLQRFHNEARAAAGLHHSNIVPVYGVGSERGVHYYAMQFIEGQTLADIIARQGVSLPQVPTVATAEAAACATTVSPAAQTTNAAPRDAAYFRRVAGWGIQAAEALDYAHSLGVVHRDVKPANLLVDAGGRLWVTDFGLAQVQSDTRLTLTGDLVGTLRYMSPEQALAKRVVLDHRTDVYSLGATLYEILALRPAFEGSDRQELLRQIALEEPRRLRRVSKAIPAELETIVLKAIEKAPQDRYATAQELADDLRHWLEDRPIRARRPSLWQVGARWARRHRPVVWSVAVVLLITGLVSGSTWLWWAQKRSKAEQAARIALREAGEFQQQERWAEALSAVERAGVVLANVGANGALPKQVEQRANDLELACQLERVYLKTATRAPGQSRTEELCAKYATAFRRYGLDLERLEPEEAGALHWDRSIAVPAAGALDDWACLLLTQGDDGWKRLLAVARAIDPDPWRNRLRDSLSADNREARQTVVNAVVNEELTPSTAMLLIRITEQMSTEEEAGAEQVWLCLQRVQQGHPDHFRLNYRMAQVFRDLSPPRMDEALGYARAAVALRPSDPDAHNVLGIVLGNKGWHEGAIVEFRTFLRLTPNEDDRSGAHTNLGMALFNKGRLDEGRKECEAAINLDPNNQVAHCVLGHIHHKSQRLDEAIAEYEKCIEIEQRGGGSYTISHASLAHTLMDKGLLERAVAEFRVAINNGDKSPQIYNVLGFALFKAGRLDEAITAFREAITLSNLPAAHLNLGNALKARGQLDEAIAECRLAIEFKKDYAEAHCNLGQLLRRTGHFREAVEELRQGHELGKQTPGWHYRSDQWLEEAEKDLRTEERLSAVLQGKAQPKDASECIAFARNCQQFRKLQGAAVRFYEEAFTADPTLTENLAGSYRYHAACAAALAGCGQGNDVADLQEKDLARLRKQSRDWLRSDLEAWHRLLGREPDKAPPVIVRTLHHWLENKDFAGMRGPEAPARLPENEGLAWEQLWADVAHLLATAQKQTPPEKKSGTK
jgi:serine/threonine protein kinase/Flp pilus assembly protein TadD